MPDIANIANIANFKNINIDIMKNNPFAKKDDHHPVEEETKKKTKDIYGHWVNLINIHINRKTENLCVAICLKNSSLSQKQ